MTRQASFRDPAGQVRFEGERIFRIVNRDAAPILEAFLATEAARRLIDEGSLVQTTRRARNEDEECFEHERVPFESYPFEWPAEMLHAAALLTLSIGETVLDDGFGLKDATPFNVLFRGTQPILVDVLSVERRQPLDPIWRAAAQFERTFLLPLIACRHFAMNPAMIFLIRRDGIEPEELYRCLGPMKRLQPSMLWTVTLPAVLGRSQRTGDQKMYQPVSARTSDRARYALRATFHRLRRQLKAMKPSPAESAWTNYERGTSYSADGADAKQGFVRETIVRYSSRRLLDIGCNTGVFSRIAASEGASVVAIDRDAAVVANLWRLASKENLDILPLVVDIARPSPSTGWENAETLSFLDRAAGRFDMVLVLALIHHLLITERIPLPQVADLIARLTSATAIVEYVGPDDPFFQRLLRGRTDLSSYGRLGFESEFEKHFEIFAHRQTGPDRYVYGMRKRTRG